MKNQTSAATVPATVMESGYVFTELKGPATAGKTASVNISLANEKCTRLFPAFEDLLGSLEWAKAILQTLEKSRNIT